jgi:hypothetical protein
MKTRSHSLLVSIILGLCLAGLLALAFSPATGLDLLETEFETELEDDWLLQGPLSVALSGWIIQKLAASNLKFSSIRIIPAAPPPKHA